MLETGTYEIIRKRLQTQGEDLRTRLEQLNETRKKVFGAIETQLLATDRITTENNCIARDMVPVGEHFIFGYNVHLGLRTDIQISDVFSTFTFRKEDHSFHANGQSLVADKAFEQHFKELYKYYKDTYFSQFLVQGPNLYMIFRVSQNIKDIKAFKWEIVDGGGLKYVRNNAESELKQADQHEFSWSRVSREDHRMGKHPHVSIKNRLFVETVGGDLTVKIEDNTETGEGIYAEEVEVADQSLDDGEILYADMGNLIILKIRPYQEKKWRYIVYNDKLKEARRIDAIADACVLLPEDQGIIFSNGYYLQTGDYKEFESGLEHLHFEKRIVSPNGEDTMYVFYEPVTGEYILLSYNVIERRVETPVTCHGYSFFKNGELVYFKTDEEAKKNHGLQIWKTPYVHPDNADDAAQKDSRLFKIGNKEIVRAMSDCRAIILLTQKGDAYNGLYSDLLRDASVTLDNYYWLAEEEALNLQEPLQSIKDSANSAIEEFEKVTRMRKHAKERMEESSEKATALLRTIDRRVHERVDEFVDDLTELRAMRGELISLKDIRYVDEEQIEAFETQIADYVEKLSRRCVEFLLRDDALAPYENRVTDAIQKLEEATKVVDVDEVGEFLDQTSADLELLIDVVSNLKIDDATHTTQIIDNVSDIFAKLNNVKAKQKAKRKDLLGTEAKAEFQAQLKLISQAVSNYLDVSDTPERCEEYLTKLMVQLEELEGKFADFDEFLIELVEKRDEVANAFEGKKTQLQEARNKRAMSLMSAADRILKGVDRKAKGFKEINDINAYFASDMMVDKVRDIVQQLSDIEESTKADDLESKLKTIKEDAVRQLRDRQELFVGGDNVIKFGKHQFTVNTQSLEASIVFKDDALWYHMSGTNFYEKIEDESLESCRPVWHQSVVSENHEVYRAEYLAYQFVEELNAGKLNISENAFMDMETKERNALLQEFMSSRYQEGYVKGVHDVDASLIAASLVDIQHRAALLRYSADDRTLAQIFWNSLGRAEQDTWSNRIKGMGLILQVFDKTDEHEELLRDLESLILSFNQSFHLLNEANSRQAARFLFDLIEEGKEFPVSFAAGELQKQFLRQLDGIGKRKAYTDTTKAMQKDRIAEQIELQKAWLKAFLKSLSEDEQANFQSAITETAYLLISNATVKSVAQASTRFTLEGMAGDHALISEGKYLLDYHAFISKLTKYQQVTVQQFEELKERKKSILEAFKKKVKLESFKPKVMASFVRNKLIDEVYLPLMGDNMAKQIGAAGQEKRVDRMGLLLLVSPPGYGKTTLMEYVASRLGLIFMKINGPAIGHQVTSVDPAEAPNATAKEELEKLNLSFEMGDNVMIYLDDIQHCNPEFLQKFISLCDAQRKIEGVYKGETKTYDFRGKKVCVVMAGNPYTESGSKFQIPDMLANRADTYNLGEIIGDSSEAFELSYIENSLTSNPVLSKLTSRSKKDLYTLIKIARTGDREGAEFESNISNEEMNESLSVLEKMIRIQETVLRVNQEYVRSAAQEDAYRTEPSFKLQGSYRNMNKMVEKVMPIMNEKELEDLILSHYEGESQTLTKGAESNLLKFKSMTDRISETEAVRWDEICDTFRKNNKLKGIGGGDQQMAQALLYLAEFAENLGGIKEVLKQFSEQSDNELLN
ncbi:DNA repair ATPase [Sediminitomix flava]|uniref:ATPase family protein associated with various cellular activities (AAA) n=1 Tax=Sediminitomix flava TaxID=379075 RepID=A0A315ZG58_SEDFL|nr:DNA repair ATPase [Sediminitomix flava]PWJ44575.1 ATPase family protein associated with various cellular activities (AAA) [Sediminitomix flava]